MRCTQAVEGFTTPVLSAWMWIVVLNTVGCAAGTLDLMPKGSTVWVANFSDAVDFSPGCQSGTPLFDCAECACPQVRTAPLPYAILERDAWANKIRRRSCCVHPTMPFSLVELEGPTRVSLTTQSGCSQLSTHQRSWAETLSDRRGGGLFSCLCVMSGRAWDGAADAVGVRERAAVLVHAAARPGEVLPRPVSLPGRLRILLILTHLENPTLYTGFTEMRHIRVC